MTDIITTDRLPEFGLSVALERINDALQSEPPYKREERIWETWAQTCNFDHVSTEDAVWFLGNGADWNDAFLAAAGWTTWPKAVWDRNDQEPALTVEVIADLASLHEAAEQLARDNPTTETLRDERNLFIALKGLEARYARTRNADMGW